MTKTTPIKGKRCPRCGGQMMLFEWNEHYDMGQEEVCGIRCYQWWDYGINWAKPKWVKNDSFIDLRGKEGDFPKEQRKKFIEQL